MNNYKNHIPPGTQDYLPVECAHKRGLEENARRCFAAWGYDEVETPSMEYYDVFRGSVGDFEQERLFKITDSSGRLLVLRPDLTMPLARVTATKLTDRSVARLFYVGDAFQFSGAEAAGGVREFTQTGVELIGQSGPLADAEVIALAITTLKAVGLTDFQIDIGQVQFFKGLMQEAGLTPAQAEQARMHVDEKNMLAIEMLMQEAGVSGELRNRILELPMLYGGPEVLDVADGYTGNSLSRGAIRSMRETLEVLSAYGLDEYVSIDLGMVQSINYYSGIIFRGISKYLGHPLLAGGRYDGLMAEFERPMAATGFALYVKPVLIALERQGGLAGRVRPVDAVALVNSGDGPVALAALQSLRAGGLRVEQFYGPAEELAAYARGRGAAEALRWQGGAYVTAWKEGEV